MKTPKLSIIVIITAIAINIICTLCGVFIWHCDDMLPTSKFSFTCLILGTVGVTIYFLIKLFQANETQKNKDTIADKNALIDALGTQISEKDKKITELTAELLSKKDLPEDIRNLQYKCETLENFRSSFPYKVADGYVIYNIIRENLTAIYSRWLIVGVFEDELWSLAVTRPADQKYKEMLRLVSSTEKPEDLKELELSENLFWE